MLIESVRHKALKRFLETGSTAGLPGDLIERLRKMIALLANAAEPAELSVPPNYGAHQLKGDRAGIWSLTVSRNWRMTFRLDDQNRAHDLDLEDYH